MSQASPESYVWWLAGRSAGLVALGLVTASVLLGLAMAARAIPPRRRRDAVRVHEHLALLGLAAIAAHGALLFADPWLKAGVSGIAVPFAISYRPMWTGFGIVGGYLAAALGLSFYARTRIGARLWRRLHRLTVVVYALGLAHTLGSGTDAQIPAVRFALLGSALPVVFLLALRVHREQGRRQLAATPGEERKRATRAPSGGARASSAQAVDGAPA